MKPKKVVRENNTKIKQVFTSLSFSKADNMNCNLYNLYSWQTNAFVGISTLSLSWSGVTRKTCSHSKTEFATTCWWYSFSFLFSNQQLRRFFAFSAIQKRSKDFSRCDNRVAMNWYFAKPECSLTRLISDILTPQSYWTKNNLVQCNKQHCTKKLVICVNPRGQSLMKSLWPQLFSFSFCQFIFVSYTMCEIVKRMFAQINTRNIRWLFHAVFSCWFLVDKPLQYGYGTN